MMTPCLCGSAPAMGDRYCRQCGRELADTVGFGAVSSADSPTVKIMLPFERATRAFESEPRPSGPEDLPADLELAYDASNGSLPPPHALAYNVRLWADGRALATFWLGYGAEHWYESWAVERADLARFYVTVRDLPVRNAQPEPALVGSPTATLTLTVDGAARELTLLPAQQQQLEALVPALVWARLAERQQAFVARVTADPFTAGRDLDGLPAPVPLTPSDTQPVFLDQEPLPAKRPSWWNPLTWRRRR